MNRAIVAVEEFHTAFDVPIRRKPTYPDQKTSERRRALVMEEHQELLEAHFNEDLVAIADAIGDMIYVLIGMALEYGIPLGPVFNEIHRSNMTKLWSDGKYRKREDGKVLKPPTYSPADIERVLCLFGWKKEGEK